MAYIFFSSSNSCIRVVLRYLYNIHLKLIFHHCIMRDWLSLREIHSKKLIRGFYSLLSDPWSVITHCHLSHANLLQQNMQENRTTSNSEKKKLFQTTLPRIQFERKSPHLRRVELVNVGTFVGCCGVCWSKKKKKKKNCLTGR